MIESFIHSDYQIPEITRKLTLDKIRECAAISRVVSWLESGCSERAPFYDALRLPKRVFCVVRRCSGAAGGRWPEAPLQRPMTPRQQASIAVLVAERDVADLQDAFDEALPEGFDRRRGLSMEEALAVIDWLRDQPRRPRAER